MTVAFLCRECGAVAVDASDVHVLVLPGLGGCGTYLCPSCGHRREFPAAPQSTALLSAQGALVIDAVQGCRTIGALCAEDAAELRELLSGDRWFDQLQGAEREEP